MKDENTYKLFEVWAYSDWKDKSTEWMLSKMADVIVSWDESDVVDWIEKNSKNRSKWYDTHPMWYKKYETI